jgi:hypothetical protein
MLRNLAIVSLLLLCAAGCRGKRASADEERAAEGSEQQASDRSRPAPLTPDVEHPPEAIADEGSGSGTAAIKPAELNRAFQLQRPSLQARPIIGTQSLNHDLRSKTAAVRMHNSGARPLLPKALGAAGSPKPAASTGAEAPR